MGMRPADHVGIRQAIMSAFTPKMLQDMTPKIQALAREIVDDIAPRGSCEFVFDVASRLPVYTFCELMGIPLEMREKVVELGNALADVETHGDRSDDPTMELFGLAHQVAQQKLKTPDGSLMSTLVHHPAIGSNVMALNMIFVVFAVAGHETTRSTAVHFMNLMREHPDQYRLLRSDPAKYLGNAIEEVLRYTSTTTNFRRTATMDTEIGGTPVKKGDKIYLSYAAANRDPAVFKDPHKFDITRENAKRHIAFGTGPHVCIGARLARIELHALLLRILERMPDYEMAGQPEWLASIWFNAITKFPIRYSARA
jgi:cholest-4-en-3-one 26-monooxygenase